MGKKGFQDFVDQLGEDGELHQELYARADDDGRVPLDEVVAFAADRGYEFRVEDVSSELSDEQLDSVAGGSFPKVNIDLCTSSVGSVQLDSTDDGSLSFKFFKI